MANHRTLTPAQERRVVSLYRDDKQGIMYITRELGVSDVVVYAALQRAGVGLRPRGKGSLRKYSRSTVQKAVARYIAGASCEAVAKEVGTDSNTILTWVREAGGDVRPAGFQPGWGSGRVIRTDGYIQVLVKPDHPFFKMGQHRNGPDTHRYVLEHRLVMAQKLGRPLRRSETVHHIDGDKTNNAPENLQLRQGKHGKGVVLCCADCGSTNLKPLELH